MVAGLDLFYLFVENVFGSILLAGLGFTIFFLVIGMMSRMSTTFLIMAIGLFVMTFTIGYIGAVAGIIFGAVALYYGISGFIGWILSMRGT
ncbi:unnamed protein product [marine sediment metagenome]|uniref:Uncharacterized protein n=1 Tax=marine sediment metagenome TaxID=412755 RepID=X1UEQ1_9ZZZZ